MFDYSSVHILKEMRTMSAVASVKVSPLLDEGCGKPCCSVFTEDATMGVSAFCLLYLCSSF